MALLGVGSHEISFFTLVNFLFTSLILTILSIFVDIISWCRGDFQVFYESPVNKGFPKPIFSLFEDFYRRNAYMRVFDCFGRIIHSTPGQWITLDLNHLVDEPYLRGPNYHNGLHFISHLPYNSISKTDVKPKLKEFLNLSSYNYFGLADNPVSVKTDNIKALQTYGISFCSCPSEFGTCQLHQQLEREISSFLGAEDALVFAMGYVTNTTILHSLGGKGTLIISDSENHCSIVVGARLSQSKIIVFRHNDMKGLEIILREQVLSRLWKKIIIVVEGLYSMEGSMCKLPKLIELKKKYKAYLYIDEAHSIGSVGLHGRGVCDYFNSDPKDVDILMGTFTKAFASVGGYIAGNHDIIEYLRHDLSISEFYCTSMAPVTCQQVLSAFHYLQQDDSSTYLLQIPGNRKIRQLLENSRYFREGLIKLGFDVIGDPDSPVCCIMIYLASKLAAFSRECLERGLAVVVVASPVTDLMGARARFCLSAAHTKEDLTWALNILDEVGDLCMLKYKKSSVMFDNFLFKSMSSIFYN